jgi:Protein of unknown function (DUF3106)
MRWTQAQTTTIRRFRIKRTSSVRQNLQVGTLVVAMALTVPALGFQRPQGNTGNSKGGTSTGTNVRFQGPGPHSGDWLRRNMNTPPAQQKQELEKSDDFKKLNPEQQQKLLRRLNRFNSMSTEQKSRVLSHMEWLEHLSPDQKKKADVLHEEFHQLPAERRQAIRRALFGMRDMNADQRQKNIESNDMKSTFSDQEREIMKGYTALGFPDKHAEENSGGSPQEEM